jgi:pilus assembly protein Flp/PilA
LIEETNSMRTFTSRIKHFLQSEDGPTAVEYAVMLALILVACIATVGALGTSINGTFSGVNTSLAPKA